MKSNICGYADTVFKYPDPTGVLAIVKNLLNKTRELGLEIIPD